MYMKKIFRFALMAVLTVGLSLAATSCKDDDKTSNNGEGSGDKGDAIVDESRDAAQRFWGVASALVSPFDVTDDYENKTFEPTIGQPMDGQPTIRVVNTGSLEAAAARFADMTGADVNENTPSYTYEDEAVGRMVYTRTNDGQSLATVDVDIKQIPGLQRIVYKSQEQMGDNGSFKGTAYYSFGDVVMAYTEANKPEFWICVRPALGMAGKEDTHWVTISPLPSKNIYHYMGKKKTIEFNMPKYLGSNYEQMQNLAELLYALFNGEQWQENINQYSTENVFGQASDLPIFGDLLYTRVKYFNKYFWQTVEGFWKKNDLFQNIFGYSADQMRQIVNGGDGLHMVYDSKWSTSISDSPTIYEYVFKNGTQNKSNMHDYKKKSVSKNVMTGEGIKVDCVSQYTESHWVLPQFFGDDAPRFIVRQATGKQLLGSTPSVYASIQGGPHNVSDVYVYNTVRQNVVGPQTEPEVLQRVMGGAVNDKASQKWSHYRGQPHYRFGDIYKDENGHKWMVLLMAGIHSIDINHHNIGDSTCFAELISLDGLTPSADKGQITNLPTRDQAIRAGSILYFYLSFTQNQHLKVDPMDEATYAKMGKTVMNQVETCGFDARMLLQIVRAQRHEYWDRQPSFLASIAYRDPADQSGKQRLLRMVANGQNNEKVYLFYFWEHYVKNPDFTSELYADSLYGKETIYLQDIASSGQVERFGRDSYARMPIFRTDSWEEIETGPDRQHRTQPDPKANDVTNYYYDMAKWRQRAFPTDMWNEPVLMFRMTAVYDRGDEEYGTVTVDGHTLTPLKVRDWIDLDGDDYWEMIFHSSYSGVWASGMCKDNQTFWLDGKKIQWPDPFETWKN